MDALALVEEIPGWLLGDDAEKLYELARAAAGPVLEIGTYRGKSTLLIATALRDAGSPDLVYSIDVERSGQRAAAAEARARGLGDRIVFVRGTLRTFALAYPHVRPTLTFIDGDHTEAGVTRDLAILEAVVPAGGLMLFHDYRDPRSEDQMCGEIRVRPAVLRSWVANACEFNGEYGCCGLFTRRDPPIGTGYATVDLMRLASLREQYRFRVRLPAAARWRRMRGDA